MTEPAPKLPGRKPVQAKIEAGQELWWCSCGASSSQPFCDGSHKGGTFRPVMVKEGDAKEVWFCVCKRTKTPPWCDGSHKDLTEE